MSKNLKHIHILMYRIVCTLLCSHYDVPLYSCCILTFSTRVRESDGKYVFIMESTTADFYKNQKPCELDTLPIFKKNQYAFGLQKGKWVDYRICHIAFALGIQ